MATPSANKKTVIPWQRWVEPWYLAYALLGATAAGLVPILLPLAVSRAGEVTHIGLVMAAFSLGGLTAPLWGNLADHYRLHRELLVGGLSVAALGIAAFPFTTTLAVWLVLALLQSIGIASAATVANLFVVEAHPKPEWDERIGWLQTFYGGGQVGGLLLAGVLSQNHLQLGLLIAAGLTALAVLPAWLTTKTPPDPVTPKPTLLHPARYAGWGFGSPQHHFHRLTLRTLRRWLAAARSSFDLFLLTWLLAMAGSAAFFALYPVLMRQVFGLSPGFSSTAFAVAAGLGLALYSPAGNWSDHFGPGRVLKIGLGGRLLAFVCILILGLAGGSQGWLALGAFTVVVLSWSLLSVGGTALTASLSPVGEGEGLGLFNAVYALAGVVGAAFGGWAAGRWGYNVATALAVTGVGLGLLITFLSHIARSSPESRSKSELNRK